MSGLFELKSLDRQETWYPTLRKTVWVLAQLHEFVKVRRPLSPVTALPSPPSETPNILACSQQDSTTSPAKPSPSVGSHSYKQPSPFAQHTHRLTDTCSSCGMSSSSRKSRRILTS